MRGKLKYSLGWLFVVVTCCACFFGGRTSRDAEVARLRKELEPFRAKTEVVCYSDPIVLRVENGQCEISVGRDDGLKPSARGSVFHGDTYLGEAVVQTMSSDRCVARLDVRAGFSVQKGDHIQFDWGR